MILALICIYSTSWILLVVGRELMQPKARKRLWKSFEFVDLNLTEEAEDAPPQPPPPFCLMHFASASQPHPPSRLVLMFVSAQVVTRFIASLVCPPFTANT